MGRVQFLTVGEAWAKVRGRLLALFGLALLEAAGVMAVLRLAVVILQRRPTAAALLGFPLLLVIWGVAGLLYVVPAVRTRADRAGGCPSSGVARSLRSCVMASQAGPGHPPC